MPLIRLVYASAARSDLHISDLMHIRKTAKAQNFAAGVSGMLCYGSGSFLQLLEGPRDAVNALYARIIRDPRHSQLELLSYASIRTRAFASWSMKMVSLDEPFAPQRRAAVAAHTRGGAFEPLRMSGRQALALMRDLAAVERTHPASLDDHVTAENVTPPSLKSSRKRNAKRTG